MDKIRLPEDTKSHLKFLRWLLSYYRNVGAGAMIPILVSVDDPGARISPGLPIMAGFCLQNDPG